MRRLAVALIVGCAVVGLLGALLLGTGHPADQTCTAEAASAGDTGHVAGYSSDQLRNATAIIDAGAATGIDRHGQILAVMVAIGESGLRALDHGDTAGSDSRGLFQQRANWGSLAQRLDPTSAARLFYARLATVPGWEQMAPTAAAHAVQGNADPDYYTPYWQPAQRLVTALTGASSTTGCTAATAQTVVGSDPHALATALVAAMNAGRITGLVPDHLREIRWIAAGRTVPNCGVDTRILQIITIALRTFGRIGISDINRRCTGQILGAGEESSHWIDGGGHAVDLYSLGGTATTGADSHALQLIRTLDPLVPHGARIGQAECRAAADDSPTLTHFTVFDDTCNHLHVDVAYTSGPLAVAATAQAAQLGAGTASGLTLFQRPFATTAPANAILPAGTTYGSATDPRTRAVQDSGSASVNASQWSVTIAQAAPGDPLATVGGAGHAAVRLRIPTDLVLPGGADKDVTVVQPDGVTAYEFVKLHRTSRGWQAEHVERTDLRGTGLDHGARASNTSQIWGVIRQADLDHGGIDHTLLLGLPNSALKAGPVWPASAQDSDAAGKYSGPVPMGTRFALPPGTDLSPLHLDRDGQALATALQRYGAYVLRRSDGASLYAETTTRPADVAQLRRAWRDLRPLLRPVSP